MLIFCRFHLFGLNFYLLIFHNQEIVNHLRTKYSKNIMQGSKLTVASSKFAHENLICHEGKVGSKKLLPRNSLVTVNFLEALANFH